MSFGEEIRNILISLGTFVVGAVSGFYMTYFTEKAKNLATREDISKITEEIERVKQDIIHQNNLVLEEVKGRHQLKMAALDRRLKAHQEAYALWTSLMINLKSEKYESIFQECREWWTNNCVYLSPEPRNTFIKAVIRSQITST